MRPIIEAHNLSFRIQNRLILSEINLTLMPGTISALVGPNGAGKSTLLRLIAGIIPPTTGRIVVDGVSADMLGMRGIAKKIAYVPQGGPIEGDCTVREFMELARYPHHGLFSPLSQQDELFISDALAFTETEPLLSRTVRTLSGGERQLVFMAGAVAQGAQVMLLDEPTAFLDPAVRIKVLELIRKLHRERDITILLVTHDLGDAVTMADTIFGMKQGKTVCALSSAGFIEEKTAEILFGIPFTVHRSESGAVRLFPEGGL